MTKIADVKTGPGILAPLLKNKFKVIVDGAITKEESLAITMQIVKVYCDYKNKVIKFEVEQPLIMSALSEAIESLIDSHIMPSLTIHSMNGGQSSLSNTVFSDLKCIKHSFDFDYGASSAATHILEFKYGSMHANHEVVKLS